MTALETEAAFLKELSDLGVNVITRPQKKAPSNIRRVDNQGRFTNRAFLGSNEYIINVVDYKTEIYDLADRYNLRMVSNLVGYKFVPYTRTISPRKKKTVQALHIDYAALDTLLQEIENKKHLRIPTSPLRADEYRNCCGAKIIHNFSIAANFVDYTDRYIKEIVEDQKGRGILLAIVNQNQKPVWGKALEDNGFKLVGSSTNPVHNDTTTIFQYIRLQGDKTEWMMQEKS